MNKIRLSQLVPTLPRYSNNFKKGPYKNGNISRCYYSFNGLGVWKDFNWLLENEREYLEKPWYVESIFASCNGSSHYAQQPYIYIKIAKEE